MTETRWKMFRESITDIDQLPAAIIENQELFWETAGRTRDFDVEIELCRKLRLWPELIEFTEAYFGYSDSVSNSHCCPEGGTRNWGGYNEGAPHGYPGWEGKLCWAVKWPREYRGHYPGSRLLNGSHIYTGTGGGGSYNEEGHQCFGYEVRLFVADWPGLAKGLFVERLKGKST